MSGYLKVYLRVLSALLGAVFFLFASNSAAWTSAHLFNVNVTVDMAESGPSKVTTDARFVVEAGYFHGFDFSNLKDATLDKAASTAFLDDQREMKVEFKRVRGGKIRVLFADDKYVRGGGITFRLVHHIDFAASGALKSVAGRARLDWTPLVWDVGLDNMRVQIRMPEGKGAAGVQLDPKVAEDYVSTVTDTQVSVIKFRPVKRYPMQVVMDFNADLVAGVEAASAMTIDDEPKTRHSAAPPTEVRAPVSPYNMALLGFICFLGCLFLVLKARHLRNVFFTQGLCPRFVMLPRTSLRVRAILCIFVVAVGAMLQAAGFLAAGTLPLLVAGPLFFIRKDETAGKPRAGGVWRPMNAQDIAWYNELFSAYKKQRRSIFDITTAGGAVLFVLFMSGVLFAAFRTRLYGTDASFAVIIDGLILAVPVWFSHIRAELPVDGTIEGFALLRKWQKSLTKLVGKKTGEAVAEFYVREDEIGPVEVRLRAAMSLEGLLHVEAAAEHFLSGTLHRIRTVFVLRMEPGAPITRKLAQTRFAAEHHLTPDLQEEIIVLRNRRGKSVSGLTPLKTALHRIGA